jgi:RimJ/RimL family protein N-acetyltransferase
MIQLREVRQDDLDAFFEHQLDETANWMAAFVGKDPSDREAFDRRWQRNLADQASVQRTVEWNGTVAGYISSFVMEGDREVCYWIDKALWGKGVATAALNALLSEITERPLHARAVSDNLASIRVLEQCGFVKVRTERAFAPGRGAEVEESIFLLH